MDSEMSGSKATWRTLSACCAGILAGIVLPFLSASHRPAEGPVCQRDMSPRMATRHARMRAPHPSPHLLPRRQDDHKVLFETVYWADPFTITRTLPADSTPAKHAPGKRTTWLQHLHHSPKPPPLGSQRSFGGALGGGEEEKGAPPHRRLALRAASRSRGAAHLGRADPL